MLALRNKYLYNFLGYSTAQLGKYLIRGSNTGKIGEMNLVSHMFVFNFRWRVERFSYAENKYDIKQNFHENVSFDVYFNICQTQRLDC